MKTLNFTALNYTAVVEPKNSELKGLGTRGFLTILKKKQQQQTQEKHTTCDFTGIELRSYGRMSRIE